ncbi:hypothetical protein [Pseudomonas abieticivorans]|uniref:hypothetical protein n=1 Tax=Pseudomonas abieticivorans TaxID=2931382 RepID=UPI0020C12301|nr:hypothetical protein [Pseudomonas sp. PIA16]
MHFTKAIEASPSTLLIHKLPRVIEVARAAVSDEGITGYIACALEHSNTMTGLLFCDRQVGQPDGLLVQTDRIAERAWVEGYELVVTTLGDVYVVAHHQYQNGALDSLDRCH